jgi:hypothetical protein
MAGRRSGTLVAMSAAHQDDCAQPSFKMDLRPKNRHDAKRNSMTAGRSASYKGSGSTTGMAGPMARVLLLDSLVSNDRGMMHAA